MTVNPGRARWERNLLISAPNLDPLLQLGWVPSQSPRGPLGGHACMNRNWQQYIIKKLILSFRVTVILHREMQATCALDMCVHCNWIGIAMNKDVHTHTRLTLWLKWRWFSSCMIVSPVHMTLWKSLFWFSMHHSCLFVTLPNQLAIGSSAIRPAQLPSAAQNGTLWHYNSLK